MSDDESESFWVRMKKVFDEHYKQKYLEAGLLPWRALVFFNSLVKSRFRSPP